MNNFNEDSEFLAGMYFTKGLLITSFITPKKSCKVIVNDIKSIGLKVSEYSTSFNVLGKEIGLAYLKGGAYIKQIYNSRIPGRDSNTISLQPDNLAEFKLKNGIFFMQKKIASTNTTTTYKKDNNITTHFFAKYEQTDQDDISDYLYNTFNQVAPKKDAKACTERVLNKLYQNLILVKK